MGSTIMLTRHDILLLANKKRYRTNLDMLTNQVDEDEDEQEEEYHQARRIKRQIFPEVEAELAPLIKKLNLACGRVQGEREQDTAATRKYSTKRKLTNLEEEIRWVKIRTTNANLEHVAGANTEASRQEYGRNYNVDAPTFSSNNSTSHLSISELASLPTDIVFLILDKLLEPIDHVRFTFVCKEWHSVAKQYNRETQPWRKVLPPMLWTPTHPRGFNGPITRLYSISERKTYSNIKLPVPDYDRIYCGHGWLAKLKYRNATITITLVNPFRKATDIIRLPPLQLRSFYGLNRETVILSADPTLNPNSYMVIVLSNMRLYFIKGGQKDWTCMPSRHTAATYHQGRVYAFEDFKTMRVVISHHVNISDDHYHRPKLQFENHSPSRLARAYFVKSTKGDLLVVERFLEPKKTNNFSEWRKTRSFKVYKWVLNEDGSVAQQVEVNSIGDEALLVSENQSVSVLASNFLGCQPNSIYYTNDCAQGFDDVGIFNLENRTITGRYPQGWQMRSIWITPSFPVVC